MNAQPLRSEFEGYHRFQMPGATNGAYGSFEVFWRTVVPDRGYSGWYWQSVFPGCLPDGEASGPFATSEGAYLAAIGD